MTKFLQYLESSGKFRKKFLCRVYRSIHIGSNSLKKNHKTVQSSHIWQKYQRNQRKHQKMAKVTKFQG